MTLSPDQIATVRRLAEAIRDSKQQQKKTSREDAAAVLAILDVPPSRNVVVATLERPADKRCRLAVGETCIWCNSVGLAKPKPKGPPKCYVCKQPFTRRTGAWRLIRGRRVHVSCSTRVPMSHCAHCEYDEAEGGLIEQCEACKSKDKAQQHA